MKKIILTGGGTAGHVTPNIALLKTLIAQGWDISYIGTENGIEKTLITQEGIKYYTISSGKLRRYMSKENFTDIFKVIKGVSQAAALIKKIKPDIIFSKGGFVTVPVVLGAKLNNVPVVIHESDITPGLANKIAIPFATKVCTTFPETLKYLPPNKGVHTGTPIREELFHSDEKKALEMCGFTNSKPIIMVMGGSLGSVKINTALREILPNLLKDFNIIHICGKGNLSSTHNFNGYKQFEYVSSGLQDLLLVSQIVVSRAGSNSISEFLALKKPNLLIPLSAAASRGDQILNANSFKSQGFSQVLPEEDMTSITLENAIRTLFQHKNDYITNMEKNNTTDSVAKVISEINNSCKTKKIKP